MSAPARGRHALRTPEQDEVLDVLSHRALVQEIETNRRAEYRLLLWTATSLCVVAVLIVVHVLWL